MNHVAIRAIEVYHPEYVVGNETYLEHFQAKGRNITNLLKAMGREKRYQINNEHETGITMAIEASKKALASAGLSGEDIDMIIFSTQVEELMVPTCAIAVHHAIGGKKACITYDMNANCAGMTIAVEQASRIMQSNKRVKRALVIGSDHMTALGNPEQEISYSNFGDASAAVILEQSETEGFIDAVFETDSTFKDNILFPEHGLSKALRNNEGLGKMEWKPFDGSVSIPFACQRIEELLSENGYTIDDVKACCFSQFALSNIKRIQEHFNLSDERMIIVGDEYGYTGTSSPFISLYEGIKRGQIQRGDIVLFWTIGGGHEFIAMLYRY